jgi:hypothetical protein
MNTSLTIDNATNATYVGEIVMGTKPYGGKRHTRYKTSLALEFSPDFPKALKTKLLSLVYIITLDGEILKIGQSSCKGGIKGCMAFYQGAGTDDCGPNRFAINYLMREALSEGKRVRIHMIYMEPIKVDVPTLSGIKEVEVPVSAKGIEENCLEEYKEVYNKFPPWNFQENHVSVPNEITIAFAEYTLQRAIKKKGE